jgi:hypothetical protein
VQIDFKFQNEAQQEFFWKTERNQALSGGINNGKTYVGCMKAFCLLTTFPRYRMVFARQTFKDLKDTTLKTFLKICPASFIAQFEQQSGYMRFLNGSEILWKHLDQFDEKSLRGLEINSALVDQAEEINESTYLVLDSRIGRWDKAQVPEHLLKANPNWPKHPLGHYLVPTYMMLLFNPDNIFHWGYRRYHPDSLERRPLHIMVEAESDPSLTSEETHRENLGRDPEWVDRFIRGKWGVSTSQIHNLRNESILEYSPELLEQILKEGTLYRALDHGDASPTCCLWIAAWRGIYIVYREYYMPNALISTHRKNIAALSGAEKYAANYADPSIFHKNQQRNGSFWTTALEYSTTEVDGPPLAWIPADNNELATRNRINELLALNPRVRHPNTSPLELHYPPSPSLYFIKKSPEYPNGCEHSIIQIGLQRKKKIGDDNGKAIYSDERESTVVDHAYDPVRYFVAAHGKASPLKRAAPPKLSFQRYLLAEKKRINAMPAHRSQS